MMYLMLTLGSVLVFFNPLANFDGASGGLGFSTFSGGGGVKSGTMTGWRARSSPRIQNPRP